MGLDASVVDQFCDPLWRLSNLYYITDKDGQRVKFTPNGAQLAYLQEASAEDIILKARQLGISQGGNHRAHPERCQRDL